MKWKPSDRQPSLLHGGILTAFILLLVSLAPSPARADACLADLWDNGILEGGYVFPNWTRVWAGDFTAMFYDGYVGTETIRGLTVVNFGTANNSDIKAVYWQAKCGATTTGLQTLSWAGTYTEDTGSYPAWTWAGTTPDFQNCAALWPLGPGGMTVDLYVDIDPCPTTGQTVKMGFPVNSINNTIWWGSMYDNEGCMAPWGDVRGPYMTILYTLKLANMDYAAPGDAVTYTIYYGRPGTANLSSIEIVDTQPPYTHYVYGSASPAPDTFWDPNPGPPVRLKWTIPGPLTVAGGPTGAVTFDLSVDWGNGNAFESGSGDVGAPEGERLQNSAQVFFNGIAGCANKTIINPPITTVVRRYRFWKVADNDVLFSQTLGQPPDEMVYSIFVQNTSTMKTWWNVCVWDTVPTELDFFGIDCGFEDPCTGWTTTPSGCAYASPGWSQPVAGTILLTWRLDMPANMTLNLRWKAKVKATAGPGSTAFNRASILSLGHSRIVDGTGHAGRQRNFTHQAPIVLPTMYTSYMPFGTADDAQWSCPSCATVDPLLDYTYYIAFYPLNRKADFALYRQDHALDAFADFGGVSNPIATPVGGCMTGGANWDAGCKSERAPAVYHHFPYSICVSFTRTHHLYKLVSNSPLLWELLTGAIDENNDQITYTGASSLTFKGFTHYSFARVCSTSTDRRDDLYIVNTSATTPTTVHIFWWDATSLSWDYRDSRDINTESQWVYAPRDMRHHKIISSDGELFVLKGIPALNDTTGNNNMGTAVPNKNNGYLVCPAGTGEFYAYAGGPATGDNANLVIQNVGTAKATYDLYKYIPDNTLLPLTGNLQHLTTSVVDSSGRWARIAANVDVRPGLPYATPDPNGHVYGSGYDGLTKDDFALYKVVLTAGTQIQVHSGRDIYSGFSSGFVLHSLTGTSGVEFWFHQCQSSGTDDGAVIGESCSSWSPVNLDFFCPKKGTAVQMVSGDGYSARYTTNAADECISFRKLTNDPDMTRPNRRNYKITAAGGTIATGFNVTCQMKQRLYSAPFLSQGVFYRIIAPPVVFLGQSFWITIVVVEQGGDTKCDYDGTTSFTSTDPGAKIESKAMDTYNYSWKPNAGGDCGVKIFMNVSMTRLGLQTVVACDTIDGSINGLTTIMVVAADVKLEKRKKLTVAASGDTVQFQICWSNFSSATAFSFTITDAVPMGTTYVPEIASTMLCSASAPVPGLTVWYSTATTTTPPGTFTSVPGTGSPLGNSRWLRWTIKDVYVNSTGCICFKVSVN